nr:MAG TPA: hypothetical protein [Caudoviricetes sp.]
MPANPVKSRVCVYFIGYNNLVDLFAITYKVDFYLFISLLRLLYKIARLSLARQRTSK